MHGVGIHKGFIAVRSLSVLLHTTLDDEVEPRHDNGAIADGREGSVIHSQSLFLTAQREFQLLLLESFMQLHV